MTSNDYSFEEWFHALKKYSESKGIPVNFPEEWVEDYNNGLTPEEAFKAAWE